MLAFCTEERLELTIVPPLVAVHVPFSESCLRKCTTRFIARKCSLNGCVVFSLSFVVNVRGGRDMVRKKKSVYKKVLSIFIALVLNPVEM